MTHWLCVLVQTPAHASLGSVLSYQSDALLPPGTLVRVPLGKRETLGVVWDGHDAGVTGEIDPGKIRAIAGALDGIQPLSASWQQLLTFTAQYYQRSLGEVALAALEPYKTLFPAELTARMAAKLGLAADHPHARSLTDSTLQLLASERVDYTLFWRRLSLWVQATRAAPDTPPTPARLVALQDLFIDREAFTTWQNQYSEQTIDNIKAVDSDLMLNVNPKYVLRNHLAQTAIAQAQTGDMTMVHNLHTVLATPFDEHPAHDAWAGLPPDWAASIEISCSS